MKEPLKNLKQAATHVHLSYAEKERMRANIFTATDAGKYSRQPSPYAVYMRLSWRSAMSFAVLLIFIMGGGTAYAAQDALPGMPLYAVKRYVNENVQQALAVSPEAQIAVHTSIAETRLKEAEALAAEGRLDATTTTELESNLDAHLTQADALALNLGAQDAGAAVEASVRIQSSLAAHSAILERLGEKSTDKQTQENSTRVAVRMRSWTPPASAEEERPAVAMLKGRQEQTVSMLSAPRGEADASSTEGARAAFALVPASSTAGTSSATSTGEDAASDAAARIALQLKTKAQTELSYIKRVYDHAGDSLSATTSAKVQDGIDGLQLRFDAAAEQYDEGDFEAARAGFTGVLRDTMELSALVEASKAFKYDFLRPSSSADEYHDAVPMHGSEEGEGGQSDAQGQTDLQLHL